MNASPGFSVAWRRGLLVSHLHPGTKAQDRTAACVIGVAGPLPGGWAATSLLPALQPPPIPRVTVMRITKRRPG